jgi:uncharacterized protein YkwD
MSEEFLTNFIEKLLAAHNHYRRIHNVKPLEYNEELSKIATKRINKLLKTNSIKHNSYKYLGQPLGENWYVSLDQTKNNNGKIILKNLCLNSFFYIKN